MGVDTFCSRVFLVCLAARFLVREYVLNLVCFARLVNKFWICAPAPLVKLAAWGQFLRLSMQMSFVGLDLEKEEKPAAEKLWNLENARRITSGTEAQNLFYPLRVFIFLAKTCAKNFAHAHSAKKWKKHFFEFLFFARSFFCVLLCRPSRRSFFFKVFFWIVLCLILNFVPGRFWDTE